MKINWLKRPGFDTSLALLFFCATAFVAWAVFFPTLRDINLQDESTYINTGRFWVEGYPPSYAKNPLIGALYAITYLIFQKSPLWMMQSEALARIIIGVTIWIGGYLIAQELKRYFSPLIFLAFFLVFPLLTDILANASDGLFAATSGLVFWQVLRYYHRRELKQAWLASVFMGLAALTRNDGVVLFFFFMAILLVLSAKNMRWKVLLAGSLPALLLVGGYLLYYGLFTGDYDLGIQKRSYIAFMQGQQTVYTREDCELNFQKCAVGDAVELYGSPEENNNSVLRAIARNPGAYFQRLLSTIKTLPLVYYNGYNTRLSLVIAVLALRGLLELFRKKDYAILGLFGVWLLYLGTYFLTFFRPGYLLGPYFIVFSLAALGVQAIVTHLGERKEMLAWLAILIPLILFGIFAQVQIVYFAMLPFLLALAAGWVVARQLGSGPQAATAAYLLLLGAGLIIHGNYVPPLLPRLGELPEEQAIIFMSEHLPPKADVAAGAPGVVLAARRDFVKLGDEFFVSSSAEEMHQKLLERNVTAIYVDHNLSNANKAIWRWIEMGIGKYYEQVFEGRQGSIRVLLVKP